MTGVLSLRSIRSAVKRRPQLKRLMLFGWRLLAPSGRWFHLRAFARYPHFLADWTRYRGAGGRAPALDWYPCLLDNTGTTGIDAQYFHQAVWAFKRIVQNKPATHVDVGSEVNFVGLLTAITQVTFVDIRPLKLDIANYEGIAGSIVALPFANASVRSFSCLHVIEHIGLGRYGDPIDPAGPEKAAAEIQRVLAPGGAAYISVPIGRPRVQFNGQRVFRVQELLAMFRGLELVGLSIVDALGRFVADVEPGRVDIAEDGAGLDFGLGMFELRKPGPAAS